MSMLDDNHIDLQFKLIEKLQGKMNVLQSHDERVALIEDSLSGEIADLIERAQFIVDFLRFGIVSEILSDIHVEDVIINHLKPIYIHHSEKGFISTGHAFDTRQELDLFIKKVLLFAGRSKVDRIMNLELPNLEGRINIAMSSFGPQITITKAKTSPLSIIDLIRAGTMSYEVAAQLWIYVEGMSIRPANILIAGGPGVGKTTLLNALFSFIPQKDRIVVIEDTLELNTFLEESCSRLESDEHASLADLVKNSLRMRPERIVVGEVRGEEARDMITACNIGKYCIGTIHALTSREAIIRLQNEPMNIPEMLVNLIDVIIVLKRYHVKDRIYRVIDEVSETSGMEQLKVLLSQVYKHDYESHTTKQRNPSTVFRDRLSMQSGLAPKDIMTEHLLRAKLLEILDQRDMTTIKEITTFCHSYAKDPDTASLALGLNRPEILGKTIGRK